MSKKNRVDFYKQLVCPDDVRHEYTPFNEWYQGTLDKAVLLENRSYSLLDYYSAFRKLYDYIVDSFAPEEINKIYCEFSDSKDAMNTTIEFAKDDINMNRAFAEQLEEEFSPSIDDDYDALTVIVTEKKNTAKLNFIRKREENESKTS
jgi:hypothetical protein